MLDDAVFVIYIGVRKRRKRKRRERSKGRNYTDKYKQTPGNYKPNTLYSTTRVKEIYYRKEKRRRWRRSRRRGKVEVTRWWVLLASLSVLCIPLEWSVSYLQYSLLHEGCLGWLGLGPLACLLPNPSYPSHPSLEREGGREGGRACRVESSHQEANYR